MDQGFKQVVESFFPGCHSFRIEPLGNGHINDTYKLSISGNPDHFVLQKINTNVFKNPIAIALAHQKILEHISNKIDSIEISKIITNSAGELIFRDSSDGAWRLTTFLSNSHSIEVAVESWQANEAGKGFGWFLKVCSLLNPHEFEEPIQNFHSVSYRLSQLDNAIAQNLSGRLEPALESISFFNSRREQMVAIEILLKKGILPTRVVHNDTKINNLLFRNKNVAAVIDLDTVGPGSILYDYGDAIRTVASTSLEDEKDLEKVDFCIERFSYFTVGFANEVKSFITPMELKHLCDSPTLMTYIMGIRFLADYINGDVYYKIKYPEHNLVRARVQQKLILSMEKKGKELQTIINNSF